MQSFPSISLAFNANGFQHVHTVVAAIILKVGLRTKFHLFFCYLLQSNLSNCSEPFVQLQELIGVAAGQKGGTIKEGPCVHLFKERKDLNRRRSKFCAGEKCSQRWIHLRSVRAANKSSAKPFLVSTETAAVKVESVLIVVGDEHVWKGKYVGFFCGGRGKRRQ